MLATVALAIAGVEPAHAEPRWSSALTVSRMTCPKGLVEELRVAQNARGDAIVAWVEQNCRKGGNDRRWRVLAVSRKPGGRFGRTRIIHSGGYSPDIELDLAIDAKGGATIAWTRVPEEGLAAPFDPALLVSTRRPGSRFGKPRLLDRHAATPKLAINAAGETVLVWRRLRPVNTSLRSVLGSNVLVRAAIRPPASNRFGSPQALFDVPLRPGILSVAIAADGAALAAWSDPAAGVRAASRPPGGRFGNPVPVSSQPSNGYQVVALRDQETGIVAWTTNTAAFVSRWDGDGYSAPVLAGSSEYSREPSVLLGADGGALLEWHGGLASCYALGARHGVTIPAQGSPGSTAIVSPTNVTYDRFITARGENGAPIRAWLQVTGCYSERAIDYFPNAARAGASVAGAPAIDGPDVKLPADIAFASDGARTPVLVAEERRRIRFWSLLGR